LAPAISWPLAIAGALLVAVPFTLAAATGHWALAGAPLGLLLGFFLAKGDLCGAAAISEILVLRDTRKLFGLWVASVTMMVGFAALSCAGLVGLCPRPLAWASYLAGGTVFGVGMVLSGGCVSGTLYKCGLAHTSSLVALLTIPVGIRLVHIGPLAGVRVYLAGQVVEGPAGSPVTLGTLTGLPYPVLAAVLASITAVAGLRARRRRRPPPGVRPTPLPLAVRVLRRPWRPATAGVAVGLLALPAWLTSAAAGRDFPLCVTYGVEEASFLVSGSGNRLIRTPADLRDGGMSEPGAPAEAPKVYLWLVLFAAAVIPGAHFAARLSGRAHWHRHPPDRLVVAAAGGLLLGIGAGLSEGCMLGNGVTGAALMSAGMVLFAVTAAMANLLTTHFWVLGGPGRS
jgi:uncharacterized membrane protein YedE/YeeE